MRVSINQPAYLPWLGYLDRIAKSDLHIILDHVPMGKDGMANRNKIRTPVGDMLLTVPIRDRGGCTPIRYIQIAEDGKWARRHYLALVNNYKTAPRYKYHIGYLDALYGQGHNRLADISEPLTEYLLEQFDITTPMVRSSDMDGRGTKSDLNLNLCLEAGASVYISGPYGREYLDIEKFRANGIEVEFHDYAPTHPVYPQCWPGPFRPCLSAIDALFNCWGFPK